MPFYFDEWDLQQIKSYLLNDIKPSIETEVELAIKAYTSNNVIEGTRGGGFFTIPRQLFPEIDSLGSFINENPKANNIYVYLKNVMGKIDLKYDKYAGFIVVIFRHGLLHQHEPKRFLHNGRELGWMFWLGNLNNPIDAQRSHHLVFDGNFLSIDAGVFYHDVIKSIDLLINEIENGKYISTFNKAMKAQRTPLTKEEALKRYDRYLKEEDFDFLKST